MTAGGAGDSIGRRAAAGPSRAIDRAGAGHGVLPVDSVFSADSIDRIDFVDRGGSIGRIDGTSVDGIDPHRPTRSIDRIVSTDRSDRIVGTGFAGAIESTDDVFSVDGRTAGSLSAGGRR